MKKQKQISSEEAQRIGEALHIDWNQIDLEQFRQGLMGNKPGNIDPETGQIYEGVLMTGKVVLNHMQEIPDYFTRLAKLEAEVDAYQARSR
jgi:Protein of unknown function (DUF5661)